jgi:acetyltransferase
MATDRVADLGLTMASLSDKTIETMDQHLPSTWSRSNPVDIIGDASEERYKYAVKACLDDENVDGVLVILTPQAMTNPYETAKAMIDLSQKYSKPLLPCWMGDTLVASARQLFVEAHKPSFRTPEPAVEVFSYLSDYYRNQKLLSQVPPPLTNYLEPDIESARLIIEGAMQEHRKILSEMESKALLSAFHIPVAKTMIAHSPNEALLIAQQFGFPVAMKINSHDITHKSDAGGVLLNLANAQAVRSAYQHILDNISHNRPTAKVDGVAIEPMIVKANERVLMVGVTSDPIFGPVITFGAGGTEVEVIKDRALSLPPLNRFLVRELIRNTKVVNMLGTFRHMPAVDMEALEEVLLRVSEMVCEMPLLKAMDINPLLLDDKGALAVDARVEVEYRQPTPDRYAHMAIYPYPTHLISHWQLANGTDITIRPIRPEDAKIEHIFVQKLSKESKFFRFMNSLNELTPAMLAQFTQLDYSREMALIAVTHEQGEEVEVGVARFSINPDGDSCEFAIVVADKMQGKGLGYKLMICLMDAARSKGLRVIEGEVLENNDTMLKLLARMGFTIETSIEDRSIKKVNVIL